ncbi:response regulator [Marisediminicola senii]|uniref:response regulator n=1 Tax=Marisediminicola senii TaxID=2711233 RepID=UPI0013EAB247|nr:response regulator [Marisediminicola senii]
MVGAAHPRTVLVADDTADLLTLVTRWLVKAGYDVIAASDGRMALDLIRERSPQVVVLDIVMPKLSGVDVLHELRADPNLAAIPVILMSAGFQGEVDAAGVPIGADSFVAKPFAAVELRERLEQQFARIESRAQPDRRAEDAIEQREG